MFMFEHILSLGYISPRNYFSIKRKPNLLILPIPVILMKLTSSLIVGLRTSFYWSVFNTAFSILGFRVPYFFIKIGGQGFITDLQVWNKI